MPPRLIQSPFVIFSIVAGAQLDSVAPHDRLSAGGPA